MSSYHNHLLSSPNKMIKNLIYSRGTVYGFPDPPLTYPRRCNWSNLTQALILLKWKEKKSRIYLLCFNCFKISGRSAIVAARDRLEVHGISVGVLQFGIVIWLSILFCKYNYTTPSCTLKTEQIDTIWFFETAFHRTEREQSRLSDFWSASSWNRICFLWPWASHLLLSPCHLQHEHQSSFFNTNIAAYQSVAFSSGGGKAMECSGRWGKEQ